jgi:hypothetical protein
MSPGMFPVADLASSGQAALHFFDACVGTFARAAGRVSRATQSNAEQSKAK